MLQGFSASKGAPWCAPPRFVVSLNPLFSTVWVVIVFKYLSKVHCSVDIRGVFAYRTVCRTSSVLRAIERLADLYGRTFREGFYQFHESDAQCYYYKKAVIQKL